MEMKSDLSNIRSLCLWRSISLPMLERKVSKAFSAKGLKPVASLHNMCLHPIPPTTATNAYEDDDDLNSVSTYSNASSDMYSNNNSEDTAYSFLQNIKIGEEKGQEASSYLPPPQESLVLHKEADSPEKLPMFKPIKLVRQHRYHLTPERRLELQKRRLNACHICCSKFDGEETIRNTDGDCTRCSLQICNDCFSRYIRLKISEGQVSAKRLICPGVLCDTPVSTSVIKANVDEEMYEKYEYLKQATVPGARFCPNPECGALQKPLKRRRRKVTCHACHKVSCIKCGSDYHKWPTCHRMNHHEYENYCHETNVRMCPTCSWPIQKVGGCSHVSCSRCDGSFCWFCLQDWASHKSWKCFPSSIIASNNKRYGPTVPIRAVTKGSILAAGAIVGAVAGVGAALTLGPYYGIRKYVRKRRRDRMMRQFVRFENLEVGDVVMHHHRF